MSSRIIHKCENCGKEQEGQYQVHPPSGWYTIKVTESSPDAGWWGCTVCGSCLPIKQKNGLVEKNGLVDLLGWLKHYLKR